MAKGFNGGIIGTRNLTTGGGIGQGTATGIWSLSEAQIARLAGIWPEEVPSGIFNGVQIFSESSTWTVPIGVTSVEYLVVGGGGGGSGYQPAVDWGGGGGAGGYLASPNISVTPTAQYTVVVGAGGAGGVGGTSGSNGSNSGIFNTATGNTIVSWAIGGGGGFLGAGNRSGGSGGGAGSSPVGG